MKNKVPGGALWVLLSICHSLADAKTVKVHGYVTQVHSETSFDIDDYKIMRDLALTLEIEKEEPGGPDEPASGIRVGTEIEVKGDFDQKTGQLTAKNIKIFPTDLQTLKRTALVEVMPEIQKKGAYWEGTVRVDGQLLLVDEGSKVSIVPNNKQKKSLKEASKAAKKGAGAEDPEAEPADVSLNKLDELHTNMFLAFEGRRRDDGRIQATKLVFKDNELTKGEARLWKTLAPKVKSFKGTGPGEIRFAGAKFKTIPNQEVQDYIKRVGNSLIPAVQRDLPSTSENKIAFQFYVIDSKVPNAFATANGIVCVHSALLSAVENEAQLAFVMGHEIAHATQEHTLRQLEFHKKKRLALEIGAAVAQAYGAHGVKDALVLTSNAISNGYQRYLENQADRVGMGYMVAAGYDAREAPRAWKAMSLRSGDSSTSFFWSSHDNNTTRRSYLMAELRNNYDPASFSSKQTDSEDFKKAKVALQRPAKIKVKMKP
jgi:hypothetical protein